MEGLVDSMKVVLADVFSLYLKCHYYHWNVEGPNFYQFHKFFGDLYEEIYDSVDTIAEHIRAIGGYAPGSYARFSALTTIEEENTLPVAVEMAARLMRDNEKVIASLKEALTQAEALNEHGIINFLEERLDVHAKHGWQLKSTTKHG